MRALRSLAFPGNYTNGEDARERRCVPGDRSTHGDRCLGSSNAVILGEDGLVGLLAEMGCVWWKRWDAPCVSP